MQTKKLQLVNSLIKEAQNADTLDGKHAEEFALASDVEQLQTKVGDTSVSEQIDAAIANKSDVGHTHTASEVGADVSGAAAGALTSAKSYTDEKIADLINSAPTTLDTLGEIATAMQENDTVVDALEDAIGTKANASDLTSHTGNKSNPHGVTAAQISAVPTSRTVNGKALSANITLSASDVGADASGAANTALTNAKAYTDAEITEWVGDKTVSEQISTAVAKKADTEHTHSAYVNQNAFGKVAVGSTTIAADAAIDTLTLVAGSNVTITPDATNDKVTIAATDTVYTHPTTSGNKHIPSGGSSGQILRWSADGTAVWGADNNTTYSAATQSAQGLMSAADKTKLDGIATGANKTTVDSAMSSTSTNPVQNKVVNAEISGLKTLVGETPVSEQISTALVDCGMLTLDPNDTAISGEATPINADTLTGLTFAQVKTDIVSAATEAAPVQSVNGMTGAITLGYADVGAAAASHAHGSIISSDGTSSVWHFNSANDGVGIQMGSGSGYEINFGRPKNDSPEIHYWLNGNGGTSYNGAFHTTSTLSFVLSGTTLNITNRY